MEKNIDPAATNLGQEPTSIQAMAAQMSSENPPEGVVVSTHVEEPHKPTFQPAVAQPIQTADTTAAPIGVAASSLGLVEKKRPPLPIGIYILVGISFISAITLFIGDTNYIVGSIDMLINIIFAIGLLMRSNGIRKLSVGFGILSIVLLLLTIGGTLVLQARVETRKQQYDEAITKLQERTDISETQRQKIDEVNAAINAQEQNYHKLVAAFYIRAALAIGLNAVIVIYLMTPKVKEAFEPA